MTYSTLCDRALQNNNKSSMKESCASYKPLESGWNLNSIALVLSLIVVCK